MRTILAALLAGSCLGTAAATQYRFDVDAKESAITLDLSIGIPIVGSLIGDYDATNNPTGTRTLPGIFGGSGNQPIPYTGDLAFGGTIVGDTTGSFDIVWSPGQPTAAVEGLSLNLLGGVPGELDLTLTFLYSTFRTFAPNSLFPGGVPIPVPLGTATIDSVVMTQTGAGTLVVTPAKGGGYAVLGGVPVEVITTITQGGQVFEVGPTPAVVPISGTMVPGPNTLAIEFSLESSQTITQPVGQPFPDQTLDLPTVLPPGGLATVIFSGTIESIEATTGFSLVVDAFGAAVTPLGDLNGDGSVDGADLSILLGAWGTGGVPADLNGDGIVNGADLSILLGNWGVNE
ncbi:MAG: hypothetical protein FJ257_00600 [Phycisphaerae bacterium]|nr:hypothetical protein [Phycisphaerae bacterium]